ncbi:hypothetical protein GCM10009785_15160 [Brooklawnia cerclae]|uniref:AcrR family transcriptional regulator n=1 Tax=Brooklawnia cerclae TaxID=349934 RepID=A0ABX0SHN7_9ACTN|nr:TetR/AcrR family transcriptional regulator [Brooklawnia cerclae]NIH57912.1 AcrR family transcriptional regulator [Brooklawnia cerclae]
MVADRGSRIRHETDQKIAQATLSIALESGLPAVTIESVAARAGVAKTTIYRRYRDRDDLLARVGDHFLVFPPAYAQVPPTKQNLVTVVRTIQKGFEERLGIKAVGLLLASDGDFFRTIAERVMHPERRSLSGFFRRGVEEGVFRPGSEEHMTVEVIIGAMFVHAALDGQMSPDWAERMVEYLWPVIAAEETA